VKELATELRLGVGTAGKSRGISGARLAGGPGSLGRSRKRDRLTTKECSGAGPAGVRGKERGEESKNKINKSIRR